MDKNRLKKPIVIAWTVFLVFATYIICNYFISWSAEQYKVVAKTPTSSTISSPRFSNISKEATEKANKEYENYMVGVNEKLAVSYQERDRNQLIAKVLGFSIPLIFLLVGFILTKIINKIRKRPNTNSMEEDKS